MCRLYMSATHSTEETQASSPHANEKTRIKRHSYEEVDLDWPKDVVDVVSLPEGKPPGHSYEEVDFFEPDSNLVTVNEVSPLEAGHQVDTTSSRPAPVRINLSHTIRRLRMCGWYWGDITSDQAKEILKRAQNGSFILRDSSDACHLFTLSLKANNIVVSVRVAFSRGLFKLDSWTQEDSPSFSSVVDMIEYYLEDESHEFYVELPNAREFPVCLKHPIWKELPRLQHLCRTTIVKYCRTSEKLRLLPLPPHLIRFVLEFSPEDSDGNSDRGSGSISDESGSISPTMVRHTYPIEPTV